MDNSNKPKRSVIYHFVGDYFTAFLSASVTKTAVAPFERASILAAFTQNPSNWNELRYKGMWDVLVQTTRSEAGFRSLYYRNLHNVLVYAPHQAMYFAINDLYRNLLGISYATDQYWKFMMANVACGAATGATVWIPTYMKDEAKSIIAADRRDHQRQTNYTLKYNGVIDVIRKKSAEEGILSMFKKGYVINGVAVVLYRGLHFGLFYSLKPVILTGSSKDSFVGSFLLALAATTFATVPSHAPYNISKMLRIHNADQKTPREALSEIIKTEGFRGLFKGAGNVLSITRSALLLTLYDTLQRVFVGNV